MPSVLITTNDYGLPPTIADTGNQGGPTPGIAATRDGNIWFTEPSINKIVELNPATRAVSEFLVDPPDFQPNPPWPEYITPVQGVGVYFTFHNTPPLPACSGSGGFCAVNPISVGLIASTNGAFAEVPILPTGVSADGESVIGMAADFKGHLWANVNGEEAYDPDTGYFDIYQNTIYEMDEQQNPVQHWAINSSPAGELDSITFDQATGDVWFTELHDDVIGVLHNGAVYQATVPTFRGQAAGPIHIAADSQGNVWFTEYYADRIGEASVDSSGNITIKSFPVPTPKAEPNQITMDPYGDMWFTEDNADQIGEIDATGHVSEFFLGFIKAVGITSAADGDLWFTTNALPYTAWGDTAEVGQVAFVTDSGVGAYGGNNQSTPVGTAFTTPLEVQVRNASGKPVLGARVDFHGNPSASGAGAAQSGFFGGNDLGSATTDSQGIATLTDQVFANHTAGSFTVTAKVDTADGTHVTTTFNLTNLPGPGTQLAFADLPAAASAGQPFNFQVAVQDQYGNLATSNSSDVTVNIASAAPGSFAETVSVKAIDGVATFTGVTLPAGEFMLTTTDGGLSAAEFDLPTPGSDPLGITSDQESVLWFTEAGSNKIGSLDPTTDPKHPTITERQIPTAASSLGGITVDQDDNEWFVETAAHKLGELGPGGFSEAELSLVTLGAGITTTVAPNGDTWVWFTFPNNAAIDAYDSTTHQIVVLVSTTGSPRGITVGPDGNIWFTEQSPDEIGVINLTSNDSVTEYPLTSGSHPLGIVAGPDGNVWFTEEAGGANGSGAVGSVNPAFVRGGHTPTVTTVPFGTGPNGITSANGSLWFTEDSGQVGTVDPKTDTIRPAAVASGTANGSPSGITADRYGNVWFAEGNAGKIGEVLTQAPSTTLFVQGASAISAAGGTPQNAVIGTPYSTSLQAKVTNASGNPVANVPVTFTVPAAGPSGTFSALATVATDALGIATAPALTANHLSGSFIVTASTPGVLLQAQFNLTNTALPKAIKVMSGNNQSAPVTTKFNALVAKVTDANGNPVSGITVVFELAAAAGPSGTAAGPTAVVTDAKGLATLNLTANTHAGKFTINAWVAGVANPAAFTLTNLPGPPASIQPIGCLSQMICAMPEVNTVFTLQAQVLDQFGNPVPGVPVTFTVQKGDSGPKAATAALLTPPTVNTGPDGVATAKLKANGEANEQYSVDVTVGKLAGLFTVENTSAPAAVRRIHHHPQARPDGKRHRS